MSLKNKLAVLIAGLGLCASTAFGAEQLIKPGAASTLCITNTTYYGTEGWIAPKYKGFNSYIRGSWAYAANLGYTVINVTNGATVETTFGAWTNLTADAIYWSPGTTSTNTYWINANWIFEFNPEGTNGNYSLIQAISVANNNLSATNQYYYGNGEATWPGLGTDKANLYQYINMNQVLKINGDEWIGFVLFNMSTNITAQENDVSAYIIGEQ